MEVEPDLLVSRELYVPAQGRGYVRVLEKFFNISDRDIEARPAFSSSGNFSSDYAVESSSEDESLSSEDTWLRLRERPYEGESLSSRMSLGHVFADEAGKQALDAERMYVEGSSWQTAYKLTVPSGDHRVVMHFITLENSTGRGDTLQVLHSLGEDVLRGITASDRGRIMNFTLCADADLDQLCDNVESQLGTNPQSGDGDGDRFEDELEVRLGSDPKSAQSIPAFDIYVLKGSDSQQLARQAGFDGALAELASIGSNNSSLDFNGNGQLWIATTDSADGAGIVNEFDTRDFSRLENLFYAGNSGKLLDIDGGRYSPSLHFQAAEVDEETGELGEATLALAMRSRWDSWTELNTTAQMQCGIALASWAAQPLILNDCKLSRYDINTWELQDQMPIAFSDDFADQPHVIALDDMPSINGLAALVEDELDGVVRRHLGFVDMETGEVVRIGSMPDDVTGIAVKFKDFENEPSWPIREMPH